MKLTAIIPHDDSIGVSYRRTVDAVKLTPFVPLDGTIGVSYSRSANSVALASITPRGISIGASHGRPADAMKLAFNMVFDAVGCSNYGKSRQEQRATGVADSETAKLRVGTERVLKAGLTLAIAILASRYICVFSDRIKNGGEVILV